jgi:hypothetical protein
MVRIDDVGKLDEVEGRAGRGNNIDRRIVWAARYRLVGNSGDGGVKEPFVGLETVYDIVALVGMIAAKADFVYLTAPLVKL